MSDMSKNKQFDVFFAPGVPASGTDAPGDQFALLVKPRRQYHDAKFEELFNFGIGGRGYTTDRTIGIRARSVTVEAAAEGTPIDLAGLIIDGPPDPPTVHITVCKEVEVEAAVPSIDLAGIAIDGSLPAVHTSKGGIK